MTTVLDMMAGGCGLPPKPPAGGVWVTANRTSVAIGVCRRHRYSWQGYFRINNKVYFIVKIKENVLAAVPGDWFNEYKPDMFL